MYHLKKDHRAEKSAELLFTGLIRELKNKPLAKITVSDITRTSTVSRATFYRNFDQLIDLLRWKCDLLFQQVINGYLNENGQNMLNYMFTFWVNNSDLLEILIDEKRTDIIYDSFMNNSKPILVQLEKKYSLSDPDYFMAIRVGVLVGIFETWIKKGKKETAEQLVTILEKQNKLITESEIIF